MRRPPVVITAEDVPALAWRYTAGDTLHPLARTAGCSPKHVREVLIAAGVQMRPPGRPRSTPAQRSAS